MKRGLLVGSAILVTGFGVMNAFWRLGDWRPDVRGLWDYRSATLGDGLLLPIAGGILAEASHRLPEAAREKRWVILAAILSASVAVYSQWSWLENPDTELNWTLPRPHEFNVAGWYHAVFLVVMSTWLATTLVLVLVRLRHLRLESGNAAIAPYLRSPWTAIVIAALVGFAGLVMLDSRATLESSATVTTLAIVGLALVAAIGVGGLAAGFSNLGQSWRVFVLAVLLAGSMCWLASEWGQGLRISGGDVFVCVMATLAIGTQIWAWESRYVLPGAGASALLMLAGFDAAAAIEAPAKTDLFWRAMPLLIAVVSILVLLRVCSPVARLTPEGKILAGAVAIPISIIALADWIAKDGDRSISAQVLDHLLTFAILFWLVRIGQRRYWLMLRVERDEQLSAVRQESSFLSTWAAFTTMLAATAGALFLLVEASGYGLGRELNAIPSSVYPLALLVLVGVLVVPGISSVYLSGPGTNTVTAPPLMVGSTENGLEVDAPQLAMRPAAWCLALVGSLIWLGVAPGMLRVDSLTAVGRDYGDLDRIGWIAVAVSGVIAVWLAATVGISLWANVAQIEFYRLGFKEWVLVATTSLAVGLTTWWLLTEGIWRDREIVTPVDVASVTGLVVIGDVLLAGLVAWSMTRAVRYRNIEPHYISLHHPAVNVAHDALLHGAMLVFVVISFYVMFQLVDTTLSGWSALTFATLPIAIAFGDQVFFAEHAYAEHVDSERRRASAVDRLALRTGSRVTAGLLNNLRCARIARRAVWVNRLALVLAPPLLALRIVVSVANALVRWVSRGLPTTWKPAPVQEPSGGIVRQDEGLMDGANEPGMIVRGTPGMLPDEVRRHLGVSAQDGIEFELLPAGSIRVRLVHDAAE